MHCMRTVCDAPPRDRPGNQPRPVVLTEQCCARCVSGCMRTYVRLQYLILDPGASIPRRGTAVHRRPCFHAARDAQARRQQWYCRTVRTA